VLLSDKVEVHKVYLQDGSNMAGSAPGSVMIRKEMRRDLVQQMVLRLEQLTPAQLETLQQLADAKAKAEAEAIEAARKAQERNSSAVASRTAKPVRHTGRSSAPSSIKPYETRPRPTRQTPARQPVAGLHHQRR
jgi:predicted component of viral defense system (DUF524 family)